MYRDVVDRALIPDSMEEGTIEGKCVAGPVLMRAQAKKSEKIHPMKVKEATCMLSIKRDYHRRSSKEGLYSEEMF